jgi:hypothetical protein
MGERVWTRVWTYVSSLHFRISAIDFFEPGVTFLYYWQFTLLPPENATGNFVKVVQRVPVKIMFDEPAANLGRLWAGESVEPRVNLRDNSAERGQRAEPLPQAIVGAPDYSAAIAEQ